MRSVTGRVYTVRADEAAATGARETRSPGAVRSGFVRRRDSWAPTLPTPQTLQAARNRLCRTRELRLAPPKLGVTGASEGYLSGVKMTMAPTRWTAAVGATVLVTGLAGCSQGGRGTPTGPLHAVETFEAALKRGDATTACDLLAPPTRKELEQSESQKCAKALPDQDIPATAESPDVEVFGDEAIARVPGDVVFLTNVGGTWMVSAAGCKPQADQPYDCEVKGS